MVTEAFIPTSQQTGPSNFRIGKFGEIAGKNFLANLGGTALDFLTDTTKALAYPVDITEEALLALALQQADLSNVAQVAQQNYAQDPGYFVNETGQGRAREALKDYLGTPVLDANAPWQYKAAELGGELAGGIAGFAPLAIAGSMAAGLPTIGNIASAGGARAAFQAAAAAAPREAALNVGIGLPESLNLAANMQTGEFNPRTFLGANAMNAAIGGALPFAGAGLKVAKDKVFSPAKNAVTELVNSARQRVAQSDAFETLKQMSARRQEFAQMEQAVNRQRSEAIKLNSEAQRVLKTPTKPVAPEASVAPMETTVEARIASEGTMATTQADVPVAPRPVTTDVTIFGPQAEVDNFVKKMTTRKPVAKKQPVKKDRLKDWYLSATAGTQDVASRLQDLSLPLTRKLNEHVGDMAAQSIAIERAIKNNVDLNVFEKEFKTNKKAWLEGDIEKMSPEAVIELERAQTFFEQINNRLKELGLPELEKVKGLYFPRRVDFDKLTKTNLTDDYEAFVNFKQAQDALANPDAILTAFEKERIFKEGIPDDYLKTYLSPKQALRKYSEQVARQMADAKFFESPKAGQKLRTEGNKIGLIDSIIEKTDPNLGPQEKKAAALALEGYFAQPKLQSKAERTLSTVTKAGQQAFTLAGHGTAIKQAIMAIPQAMQRHKVMSTLEYLGGKFTGRKMVGLGDVQVDMLGNLDTTKGKINAITSWGATPGFTATQIVESDITIGSAFTELVNAAARAKKTGKPTGEFKTFLDRNYSPEKWDLAIDRLAYYKKNQKADPDIWTIADSLNNARMKGSAFSKADKPRFANEATGGAMGENAYKLLTWGIKNANATLDRTVGAMKRGDYETAFKTAIGTTVLMGSMAAGTQMFLKRYQGRTGKNPSEKEFLDEYRNWAISTMFPLINDYVWERMQDPSNLDTVFTDLMFKGLSSATDVIGGAVKYAAEGTPEAILDREINPDFRKIPIAGIPEAMYRGSRAFKERRSLIDNQESAKEDKAGTLAMKEAEMATEREYWRTHIGGTPSVKKYLDPKYAGTTAGNKALERSRKERTNQEKYFTDDPEIGNLIRRRKPEYERTEMLLLKNLTLAVQEGRLTPEQATAYWDIRIPEITKRMMYNEANP